MLHLVTCSMTLYLAIRYNRRIDDIQRRVSGIPAVVALHKNTYIRAGNLARRECVR